MTSKHTGRGPNNSSSMASPFSATLAKPQVLGDATRLYNYSSFFFWGIFKALGHPANIVGVKNILALLHSFWHTLKSDVQKIRAAAYSKCLNCFYLLSLSVLLCNSLLLRSTCCLVCVVGIASLKDHENSWHCKNRLNSKMWSSSQTWNQTGGHRRVNTKCFPEDS